MIKDVYYVPESLRREFSEHELAEFREQFQAFDTSGDGGVDADELAAMMALLDIHVERRELVDLVAVVDADGSGQIEFHEFVRMMSNLRRGQSTKLSKFIQMSKQAFEIREECRDLQTTPVVGCRANDKRERTCGNGACRSTARRHRRTKEPRFTSTSSLFGRDYPYEPPTVVLHTRIYHVNFIMLVDGTAPTEWLSALWTPDWRARSLIERLQHLLQTPEPDLMVPIYNARDVPPTIGTTARSFGIDCFNQYVEAPEAFARHARDLVRRQTEA
ncbi:Aste57867_17927 [Aphanomyces stellatus]|uniref:Aste57867_17927 protein n=1 Tax=Aphanomyces stellatus TaxID=120398 RepID=A0A485L9F2_9STRA|nr:hypothetical protein As57867_017865 [Aphanomyces stellatus]VFT94668.1 Aste57867_17927 [Aphanomyces stellatus]